MMPRPPPACRLPLVALDSLRGATQPPGPSRSLPRAHPPTLFSLSHAATEHTRRRRSMPPWPQPLCRPADALRGAAATYSPSSPSYTSQDGPKTTSAAFFSDHGRRMPPSDSPSPPPPRAHQPLRLIRCELLRQSPPSPGTFSPANANIHRSGELTTAVVPCRRGQGHRSPHLSASPCSVNPQEHVAPASLLPSAP